MGITRRSGWIVGSSSVIKLSLIWHVNPVAGPV